VERPVPAFRLAARASQARLHLQPAVFGLAWWNFSDTAYRITPAPTTASSLSTAMNNQQFRRLLLSDTPRPDGDKPKPPAAGAPKTVLGARKHSSIPMTP
jgi:hypothetical protein